jgi:hypothetical protein
MRRGEREEWGGEKGKNEEGRKGRMRRGEREE